VGTIDVAKMYARVWVKKSIKSVCAAPCLAVPGEGIGGAGIVVLMYHRVNPYRKNDLSVNPREFRKQLRWLVDHGFENMRMRDIESGSTAAASDRPRVIFTFDDGYEDNYLIAAPILKEHGYSAIFYISVNYVSSLAMDPRDARESGRSEHNRWMTWEQAKMLIGDRMEIGSHGMNHLLLTRLCADEARREIVDSRRMLELNLSVPVTSFCYPGGFYGAGHVSMVREAGYRSACTASPGTLGGNLFEIPRVAVQASDTFFVFTQKLRGRMRRLRVVR
jgi:peptidoglycan/xylan/chitin deacetylase (PgdA/CDA1 family)